MGLSQRKLLSKKEIPFFLALAAVLLALIAANQKAPPATVAAVEVDGRLIAQRELAQLTGPETLTVAGRGDITLTVEFSPEGVRITEADCPDKTCVRTGTLTRAGESAVCLPGRVVVRLEGPGDTDAVTY